MWTARASAAVLLAALVAGCGSSSEGKGFSANVNNAWFPLRPGSVYRYRGVKDGEPSREVMTVTHRTRTIDGAHTVVVSDLLYLRGKLEERTRDYYTQDADGNVWYFGEDTAELDPSGRVKTREGTWHAGEDGAKPGIFMYARPRVGQSARQEFLRGQAEDHFQVLRRGVVASVPLKTFRSAMLTKEWTPLEPGVLDHKYYARGIGTVLEQTVRGGDERNELVSFSSGGRP
ncbi:MAG TPA: hypothetical protein VGP56_06520 [Gaiellaceae bacterium]|nr:hypothetical protein [Gaiellaceae bacterium]